MPWNPSVEVLSTGSFPSTSILRKAKKFKRSDFGTCTCQDGEHHSDLFKFNLEVVGPHLRDSKKPITGFKVCWNAENIWESKLPRCLTGLKNRVMFHDLPSVYVAQKVLYDGTYWYSRLISPDGAAKQISHGRNGVAILRLLAGKSSYAGKERVDQLVKLPVKPHCVKKLQNLLATVDGLLMQIVLAFPLDKEIQSWSFMDRVSNSLICCLLPDYFGKDPVRITAFEKVKMVRKTIKEVGFNPIGDFSKIDIPQELSFFRVLCSKMGKRPNPWRGFLTTLLSQTRASGVPPQSVYSKTMEKIHSLLKEPADPSLYEGVRPFIGPAVQQMHQEVLLSLSGKERTDKFFSRCVSAAKVSLSDSGEFFTKSEDGGKLEAARKVLSRITEIEVIDLNTGRKTGNMLNKYSSSPGDFLFQWSLHQFHDRETVYDKNVMSVRISLVAELGKYRAITVSHLAHAVLLHVLSHVLLEYISVIPSSASGVGAANHAWEFFKRMSHKNPSAGFIFGDQEKYFFSSDLSQATDYGDHNIACAMLNHLCRQMGVPEWYRQTCVFALCAPRQVETIDHNDRTMEMFLSTRGILMGDPVTKVVLHLFHLVTRYAIKGIIGRKASSLHA